MFIRGGGENNKFKKAPKQKPLKKITNTIKRQRNISMNNSSSDLSATNVLSQIARLIESVTNTTNSDYGTSTTSTASSGSQVSYMSYELMYIVIQLGPYV